jgi:signal transduction histidine kinase
VACETKDNHFWLGTNRGLYRLRQNAAGHYETIQAYTESMPAPYDISNNYILSLQTDSDDPDILWVGTRHGVNRVSISGKGIKAYTMADGLPNDVIYSILPGDAHELWMGTNQGLVRIGTEKFEINHYTSADGLKNIEFNSNVGVKLADGRLVYGGVNGLTTFYPDALKNRNNRKPVIVLSGIEANGRQLTPDNANGLLAYYAPYADEITQPATTQFLNLQFSILWPAHAGKAIYRYRLVGLNDQWVNVGNENSVTFANLPSGKFTFEVQGKQGNSDWSDIRSLSIVMMPPWWKSTLAWATYAIAFVFLCFLLNRIWQIRRKRYEAQLHLEQMKQLEQFRSRLFANITHEIRTPLSLILGITRELIPMADAEMKSELEVIQNSSSDLMSLTEQILDLSRIDQNSLRLYPKRGNLNAFLQTVYAPFRQTAREKGISFCLELPEQIVSAVFEERYLKHIMHNLLSNAFKFTPQGKSVTLTLRVPDVVRSQLCIEVSDTGIGISPKELDKIFDRFYQVENAAQGKNGTGIGLAYVRELVQLMQGKVAVKSTPGQGTTFQVYIPWTSEPQVALPASV